MASVEPQEEPAGRAAPEPGRPASPTVEAAGALNVPLPGDGRIYVLWVEALKAGTRVGSRWPTPEDVKAECRREAEKLMPAEGAGFGLWALIIVPAVIAVFMGLLAAELIGNGSGEPERVGVVAIILTVLDLAAPGRVSVGCVEVLPVEAEPPRIDRLAG